MIERLDAVQLHAARADLIALLQDVVNGGASVNFVAPLSTETAAAFWTKVEGDAAAGQRIVIAAYDPDQPDHVIGSVQLALAPQQNGSHRAEVQKLLVHSAYRQRGIGRALMTAVESAAHDCGRTLLVLDTELGSVAENLYERVGYSRAGIIPGYALSGDGTRLVDTVLFYRQL